MTEVRFDHLLSLSTPLGVFEHTSGESPRRDHGYCLDDVGRVLVVLARQPDPTPELRELASTCLAYTSAAADGHGQFRNRRSAQGVWTDRPFIGDHWGRALWGLSQIIASPWCPEPMRRIAFGTAVRGLQGRTHWRRAAAHAAVAAADIWAVSPGDPAALALAVDVRSVLAGPPAGGMPWPEPRLTYANPLIAEGHLAIGQVLGDQTELEVGLRMLQWLIGLQTVNGHLSMVPTGGWAPGELLPGFDQQPIEVASLAEAAWRAFQITGEPAWADVVHLAAEWFLGRNDIGQPMYDESTGGGFDGLGPDWVNHNQGAESTLAALATLQLASRPVATHQQATLQAAHSVQVTS